MKHAADGSGMVTFEFDGDPIPALAADGKHNTDASIPAGIVKDDALDLTVTYQPDGDMGEGEFEIRLPSGWDAEDVQGAGVERSGRTVTVSFPHDRFGEGDDDLTGNHLDRYNRSQYPRQPRVPCQVQECWRYPQTVDFEACGICW